MRIFDYAKVADWDDRLLTLAGLAEPERWTYRAVPAESPLPVLDGYVKATFLRLHEQGNVAEIDELACFNTGLLTPGQEEIFGLFTVSETFDPARTDDPHNRKWWLKLWARSGDRILTDFPSLPELASYWDDPADLVFNPALEVRPNVDHILRENLSRFPVELGGQVDAAGVPHDLHAGSYEDEAQVADGAPADDGEQPPHQESASAAPIAARIALDGAIKHSIRLAERSYRLAVPQFYYGEVQLLLPLYLRDARRPDLALTLQRHGDWYRAATVLYPDWAYRHARLLSRPNSEWLGGFRSDLE